MERPNVVAGAIRAIISSVGIIGADKRILLTRFSEKRKN